MAPSACSNGWRRTGTSRISAWWASRPIRSSSATSSKSAEEAASTPPSPCTACRATAPIRKKADNPVHRLVQALAALTAAPLDAGSTWFQPSTLQVTSADVGNLATNVIPAEARAKLNIRFNDLHRGADLEGLAARDHRAVLPAVRAGRVDQRRVFPYRARPSGRRGCAVPSPRLSGREPRLDTGGGTSRRALHRHATVRWRSSVWWAPRCIRWTRAVPVDELRQLAANLPRRAGGTGVMQRSNPLAWHLARRPAAGSAGMARFGATTQSFLSSLAPLLAFPIAGSLILLLRDGLLPAIDLLAVTLVAQLAPPVLSHLVAVALGPRSRSGCTTRRRIIGATGRFRWWRWCS